MSRLTIAQRAAIAEGRAYLHKWLSEAEQHGEIYYTIPHVARSGMSRRIVLATIRYPALATDDQRPQLHAIWPRTLDPNGDSNETLEAIGRDWGFSFKHRAFIVGGCGMDMVFALVDDLAGKAGMPRGYANRVRREHFG